MVLGVVNLFGVEALAAAAAATLVPERMSDLAGRHRPRDPRGLDSTNAEALRRAAAGEAGPLWILARRQTAARGRRGRAWVGAGRAISPRRLLMRPPARRAALRSFVAALGLFDAMVAATGRPELFALKWPNDVLLSGGKLAGILLETGGRRRARSPSASASTSPTAPDPDELEPGAVPPVGLRAATGVAVAPEEFLDLLAPAVARLGGPAGRRGLRAAARRLARPRRPARRGDHRAAAGPRRSPAASRPSTRPAPSCSPPPAGRVALPAAEHRTSPRRPPMLLAIDVGNTNMVFALHDGERVVAEWRCRTERQRTADEYFVWLRQLMDLDGHRRRRSRPVVVSSVVPQVVFNLRVLADRYFHTRPLVVGKPEVQDRPAPPRVDPTDQRRRRPAGQHRRRLRPLRRRPDRRRLRHRHHLRRRRPRRRLRGRGDRARASTCRSKALHDAAAALPFIDVTKPERVVGTNTVACMQSGIYWGYIGLIEGICARIRAETAHAR